MREWIANTNDDGGYVGIALLMFLANLFPPIASKLIMPLGGFTARATPDKLYVFGVFLAGVIGWVLGALIWYYPGKFLAQTRL
jgi:membrane protein DedA with SNARE-associated domain